MITFLQGADAHDYCWVTCRHHRYIFEEKQKGKEGSPQVVARLQELGPRFTLKLQSLQVSL